MPEASAPRGILETAANYLLTLVTEAVDIWRTGGWAMIAIAVIAILMFGMGTHLWFAMSGKRMLGTPERIWRRWIGDPSLRQGSIGQVLDYVTAAQSLQECKMRFNEVRKTEVEPFARDLRFMRICVSAAPLVGLLGTVTGMLTTFGALGQGSGGEKTMGLVAQGISEALITTETGLVIAVAGSVLQYQLARKYARLKAFIAHLETVCTQKLYRTLQERRRAA